jgi:hypothetical protein
LRRASDAGLSGDLDALGTPPKSRRRYHRKYPLDLITSLASRLDQENSSVKYHQLSGRFCVPMSGRFRRAEDTSSP